MPLDPMLVAYGAIWTALEADSGFVAVFKAGNRIKRTGEDSQQAQGMKTAIGDYPQIVIGADAPDYLRGAPKFFNAVGDMLPDYPVPIRLTFPVTILHDSLNLTSQSAVEAAIAKPIVLARPRLGQDWIDDVEIQKFRRGEENSAETGNVLRTVSRSQIIVTASPYLSALTT